MAQTDLARVQRAALERTRADASWKQAILLARASGETFVDIATVAGVIDERVRQIVDEETKRDSAILASIAPLEAEPKGKKKPSA